MEQIWEWQQFPEGERRISRQDDIDFTPSVFVIFYVMLAEARDFFQEMRELGCGFVGSVGRDKLLRK